MIKKAHDDPASLITQAEAAELRGVTLAAINELVRRGRLATVEMFGRKLLRRSDVESFTPAKTGPKTKGKTPKPNHKATAPAFKKRVSQTRRIEAARSAARRSKKQ